SGHFYNDDGNGCADLVKGQCSNAQVNMVFTTPVTIKCLDSIGANGSTQPDGFVDIPTCTTWGNNKGQVGPGGACNSETNVEPGTGSKCQCQVVNSNVPAPRLATSCACSPTPVRPGQSTACTVSFTNTIPNCTATVPSSTTERFECGTASFVRYKVGYNPAQGQVLNSSSAPATPVDTNTGGTETDDTPNNQVAWEHRNPPPSGAELR